MKPTIVLFLGLAFACAGAASATQLTDQTITRYTFHLFRNKPHTLEVRVITGTITVVAYPGPDIQMRVVKTITADTPEDLRAAKQDVALDTSLVSPSIRAIVRQPHQSVCGEGRSGSEFWWEPRYQVRFDFTIRVPQNVRLDLCTINDGDVSVTGVRGSFSVHSVNGRITMTGVAGSGEAVTVNGAVAVSFATQPHAASHFSTINGAVVVTLPGSSSADLHMKAFNGGMYTDFPTRPLPVERPSPADRKQGMTFYRFDGYTNVRIGHGGPELTLDTLNGDVQVLQAQPDANRMKP